MRKLWEGVVNFFATASADVALKILGAAVMLFAGFRLVRFAVRLLRRAMQKGRLDPGVQDFLENAISIALRFTLIISVLVYLGVPAASFVAILTSAGLAIGLALQGSLSNLAGGMMLLLFHPFRTGDYIRTDGAEGVVQSISVMYTTLKTPDGRKVVIPNSMLSNGIITDFTWHDTRRVDVSVTVGLSEDSQAVRAILEEAARSQCAVLPEPAPAAFLEKTSDGVLQFTLRCWARTSDWWDTLLAVTEDVKARLDQAGIPLRAPTRDVRQVQETTR